MAAELAVVGAPLAVAKMVAALVSVTQLVHATTILVNVMDAVDVVLLLAAAAAASVGVHETLYIRSGAEKNFAAFDKRE